MDETRLPTLIKEFEEDVKRLRTLNDIVKVMDSEVSMEEVTIGMGNLPVGSRSVGKELHL